MAAPKNPPGRLAASYRDDGGDGAGDRAGDRDRRLFAPTFLRNSPPMIAQLTPWLAGLSGPVLEIGAGTGQHAAAFALAFPQLEWWPSDPDAAHRASVSAWQTLLRAPQRKPIDLDAAADWPNLPAVNALGPLSGVVSMNVIHIAPFDVARGIVAGAGETLARDGLLIFYGPFRENASHTGPGNAAFDKSLRGENPNWGLRDTADIGALAKDAGLGMATRIEMPANNLLLIFRKT